MLQKEDAVALFKKYQELLHHYMRTLRSGARISDMYCQFPEVFKALDSISKDNEQDCALYHFLSKEKSIFENTHDPLQIIQNFVEHYSQETFAIKLQDDVHDTQFLASLNEFYSELCSLCVPKPILLYKGRFENELALKFPSILSHDNFVAMMKSPIGKTYSDKPTVLFIPGSIEAGHLVAIFPCQALREEAINLLGLTGRTITRQDEKQLIINSDIIIQQGQNITIDTPEHLYRVVKKQAYNNFCVIAKGLGAYAKSSHSFFSGLPVEINKKIASTFAEVIGVELDEDTSQRVASTHIGI
ncbi:hypothetical protein [Legionella sainthelensi]|uniref:Dot/Icm T4SS effector n=1 Tax=Legionella sainthelensi TaxID=28087 RepID=A0A2H5FLN5_9GAMM|nr:hypothetical protein [Legionella sainthelensi]AUH72466.1 hypothetical protein CAB17_10575 [Legionella sainthelensi]